jgi:hypothetical protein
VASRVPTRLSDPRAHGGPSEALRHPAPDEAATDPADQSADDGTPPAADQSGTGGRTRRALLAAAAGGVGAWVAGAVTSVAPVAAASGSPLIMGKTTNSAGTRNTKLTTTSTGAALMAQQKGAGTGVYGFVAKTTGVARGVYGRTMSPAGDGMLAVNSGASIGGGSALRAQGGKNNGVEASSDNIGVHATGAYAAVSATGTSYGGIFEGGGTGAYASGSYGVYSLGTNYGVYGSGGVYGLTGVGGTAGVYGYSSGTGVLGTSTDLNNDSIRGDGGKYGVHGINGYTAGVRGDANYVGVWGQGATYGVYGYTTGTTTASYGVMGQSTGTAWAVYGIGNVAVQGTLVKSAGSFRIDHPLDPEHKLLSHSFVESPDMMNVYNGVADLDASGRATIDLPDYFEALNRDFRYQLTAIGGAAPDLHVAKEVKGNGFAIAGGTPNGRVSWQVTGIRQDDYAKAHPIVVEEDKDEDHSGTRLFVPEGSKSRQWLPQPVRPKDDVPTHHPKDLGRLAVPVR